MDHVVLVLFENRSFDNLLGRLYAPGDVEAFEGVIGKDLSNPIPAWAEHGAEGGVVPYGISPSMDAPDPDPGEEYQHTNTQLFNVLDEANRFKDATEMVAPHNAPPAGTESTMEGFVTDYISFLTFELGRQPTYEEYSQIMTGYTPEQVPVISALARGFGVFDHWFSEVPSQTLANRSFWTAATSSGFVVNRPVTNFMRHNTAETIFNRLERCGKTWKVYVLEPDPISFTGFIHMARLRERFATNFVPFAEFEADAAAGTLPDFSLIEPNLLAGHGDYHPAFGRALIAGSTWRSTHPRPSSPARPSWAGSTTPCDPLPRKRDRTPSTPCSSSASTSREAPTTTSHRDRCRPRIPRNRSPSSGSPSTARATGCRR
jgi:phospholipase C